jgi:hypothetical protein
MFDTTPIDVARLGENQRDGANHSFIEGLLWQKIRYDEARMDSSILISVPMPQTLEADPRTGVLASNSWADIVWIQ